MLKKGSWFRPADAVLFVPATPGAELADKVKEVVEEESKRLNFKVKVVERGGTTMKQHLVRTDMGIRQVGSLCHGRLPTLSDKSW